MADQQQQQQPPRDTTIAMDQGQQPQGSTTPSAQSSQVIHIRGDSDSELQALFDSVLSNSNVSGSSARSKGVPLRLRKLPDSFFNPPKAGTSSRPIHHGRDCSVDSGLSAGGGVQPTIMQHGQGGHGGQQGSRYGGGLLMFDL